MSQMPQDHPQERIKVWRPQGFAGLEVELFENISVLEIPNVYFDGFYEMTVARGGNIKLHYMHTNYHLVAFKNLFLVQHPGETVKAINGDDIATAYTLRLYPEVMTSVKAALGLKTDVPYFPSMLSEERLNAPIAKLASEALTALDLGASHLECESRLLGLMHAVLTHMSDTPPPEEKLGDEHSAVSLVKEVLHAHVEETVRLEDLASLTNLSTFHVIRVFKRDVGLSPHEYQTNLRLTRAKGLLAQGEKIMDVALDVGYSDQAHFTRTFKRYTLTTPGKFQRLSCA